MAITKHVQIPHQLCQPTEPAATAAVWVGRNVTVDEAMRAWMDLAECAHTFPEEGRALAHALAHPALTAEQVQASWEALIGHEQCASAILHDPELVFIVLEDKGFEREEQSTDPDARLTLALEYAQGDIEDECYYLATGGTVRAALAQDRLDRLHAEVTGGAA